MNQNLLSFRWFSPPFFFLLFIIFFLTEPGLSIDPRFGTCVPKSCSRNGLEIRYPFWIDDEQPSYCGYPGFKLTCRNDEPVLDMIDTQYIVRSIFYEGRSLSVVNAELLANPCPFPLNNLTFNRTPFNISPVNYNLSILNCSTLDGQQLQGLNYFPVSCLSNHTIAVWDYPGDSNRLDLSKTCENSATVPLAMKSYKDLAERNYSKVLQKGFLLNWTAMDCSSCNETGGQCGYNESISLFQCFCADRPHKVKCNEPNLRRKIIIGACVGIGCFLLCIVIFFSIRLYRKKYYHPSSTLLSRAITFDPSFKSDIEKSNSPYPTQFFNYKELEEATNNFDPSRELGDGGFGTVYHGKLHDGRSVAVKRLYESNYRRVEQFKNEINILSHLRHQNLVTLYGCSSRHSRELLLVYEYIPNGTVADHLHGDRVKPGALTWPIRMSIAIETADALKYLHAVEIIHRDVKTNNILLDNNFGVKVADFGLSRLFPTDVTHVSTAPQGTPGYVDPDYHRCYQLTHKSDVYSFGVVMIELISSKPAVDISRHRYEINLANMAINKIHNHALHELVDPTLGFDSDYEVKRMITLVAELAFRCLQDEKDVRPSMEEVLDTLNGIKNDGYKVEKAEDVGTPADDTVLLKNFPPLSPDTVTGAWESRTTTPNTSG